MNKDLEKIGEYIDNSNNIPSDIREIVKAICRGYIRESKGRILLDEVKKVCDTTFVKISEDDTKFSGENKIFGETDFKYDKEGHVSHTMYYSNSENIKKLICILTHELGHVITENDTFKVNAAGYYPLIKRTCDFYLNCFYNNDNLMAKHFFGFRITDGFIETIASKIYNSSDFREELLKSGYDLEDYVYKDERIFPSRVYDEFKISFQLFDELTNGSISNFVYTKFDDLESISNYLFDNDFFNIFHFVDAANDALWQLKRYEDKPRDENFTLLAKDYLEKKDYVISEAYKLLDNCKEKEKIEELINEYKGSIKKFKNLPFTSDELNYFDNKKYNNLNGNKLL